MLYIDINDILNRIYYQITACDPAMNVKSLHCKDNAAKVHCKDNDAKVSNKNLIVDFNDKKFDDQPFTRYAEVSKSALESHSNSFVRMMLSNDKILYLKIGNKEIY